MSDAIAEFGKKEPVAPAAPLKALQPIMMLLPVNDIVMRDLARPINTDHVAVLAASIERQGLLQPIGVKKTDEGDYVLTYGAHRLAAAKSLGWGAIDVALGNGDGAVDRVSENLMRGELTALERAEHISNLKELLSSTTKSQTHGGDRKGKKSSSQNENLISVSKEIARRTGFDKSAVSRAVIITTRISMALRSRIHGTWLADHLAGLLLLAEQEPTLQTKIMQILFPTQKGAPVITTVVEALLLAQGAPKPDLAEKAFHSTFGNLGRMRPDQRVTLFLKFEDELRAAAVAKGWMAE